MHFPNLPLQPFVLVSYRHEPDDPEHGRRVEALVRALRVAGVRVAFDRDHPLSGPHGQTWEQWMDQAVEHAAATVMVWSPGYKRGWDDVEDGSLGVPWETGLIRTLLYLGRRSERLLSVLATGCNDQVIAPRHRLPHYPLEGDHSALLNHLGPLLEASATLDLDLERSVEALLSDLVGREGSAAVVHGAVCALLPGLPELISRPEPADRSYWCGRAARAISGQGWELVRRLLDELDQRIRDSVARKRLQRTALPLRLAQALSRTGLFEKAWPALASILSEQLSHDATLRSELRHRPDDPLSLVRRALVSIGGRATDPASTLARVAEDCLRSWPSQGERGPLEDWIGLYGIPVVAAHGELPVLWLELASVGADGGLPWRVDHAWARLPHGRPQVVALAETVRSPDDLVDLLGTALDLLGTELDQLVVQLELELDAARPGLLTVQALDGDLADAVLVQTSWPRHAAGRRFVESVRRDEDVDHIEVLESEPRMRLRYRRPVGVAASEVHRADSCPVVGSHGRRVLCVLHPGPDPAVAIQTMFGEADEAPLPHILQRLGALTGAQRPFLLWTDVRYRPYDPNEDGAKLP